MTEAEFQQQIKLLCKNQQWSDRDFSLILKILKSWKPVFKPMDIPVVNFDEVRRCK